MSLAPLPPYALAATSFPLRHLVALAGRAPIGGAREVALACFVTARLVTDRSSLNGEARELRAARCAGAKAWLGTLALPPAVKQGATRCTEATVEGVEGEIAREMTLLVAAAASYLDAGSKAELEAVAKSLSPL